MMYEAEELGVHTIWIRGFDSKTVVDTFGLPENMIPVMMLGLGYPNERAKANAWHYRRKPIDEFVTEREKIRCVETDLSLYLQTIWCSLHMRGC